MSVDAHQHSSVECVFAILSLFSKHVFDNQVTYDLLVPNSYIILKTRPKLFNDTGKSGVYCVLYGDTVFF